MFAQSLVVLCVVAASTVSAKIYSDNVEFQQFQFKSFMQTWNKKYSSIEEERLRFGHFINNLRLIDARNVMEREANGTAVHGITRFTDLSEEEFFARYLTVDMTKAQNSKAIPVSITKPVASGTTVDWTGVYTTPVKDQGYCGSWFVFLFLFPLLVP